MDIGSLDEKITFTNNDVSDESAGGENETIGTAATAWQTSVWARVERKSGFRNFSEGYDASVTRYDMWVRWNSTIAANIDVRYTRIIYDGKRFSLDSEPELIDEKKRFYHFSVTAVS
jgi:head-tail adaptor